MSLSWTFGILAHLDQWQRQAVKTGRCKAGQRCLGQVGLSLVRILGESLRS